MKLIKLHDRLHNRKHKTLTRYMATNLLFLAIAFLFGTVVFNVASRIVEDDIKKSDMSMLKQSMETMDQKFSLNEMAAQQICTNSAIIDFSEETTDDNDFYFDMLKMIDEISNYKLNLDRSFVYDYFVYFKKSGYLVTPDASSQPDLYYNTVANKMSISPSEWQDLLDGTHNADLQSITMYFNNQRNDELVYMQSVPMRVNSPLNGTLVMLIRKSGINALFSGIDLSRGGWFYVLDKKGNLITSISKNPKDVKVINLKGHFASEGSFDEKINGTKMVIDYTISSDNGMKYVLVLPENVMMSELYNFERVCVFLFILVLLIGVVLAFYMAYYNTKPMMNIIKTLKSTVGVDDTKDEGDTLNTINSSISTLIINNKSLEENVSRLSRDAFVERLLKGDFSNLTEVQANIQYIGVDILKSQYLVMIVKVYGRNMIDGVSKEIVNEINTVKVLLMDTCSERFGNSVLYQNIDLQSLAIVLCFDSCDDYKQQVTQSLEDIFKEYLERYKLKLLFGIGNFTTNILDVWRSYQEAMETVDFVQLHREGKIKWYDEIPIDSQGFYYPIDFEQRIMNYVKAGDTKELENIFAIIIDENFEKRKLPCSTIRELFYDIKGTTMKLIQQTPKESDYFEQLKRFEFDSSSEDNFNNLLAILKSICQSIGENRNNKYQSLINDTIEFVKHNYMNQELGLSLVASEFNISEGYLSYLFKEQTGQNFTDLVEHVRMDEACKLLQNTKLNINEIYLKVGYSNVQSFRRAFKRIKGVSPMLIRNGTV